MEAIQAVLAIVLIDLTLSGDNAVVIGLAARNLPAEQRRRAIILGGVGAVVVRVLAAAAVTLLLAIPLLQFAGGLVLVGIAYRLARPPARGERGARAGNTLRDAIITILLADAAMSLENILGVGAAAHGSVTLLAFGLALSIPIVLFGSGLVVEVLQRFSAAIWLGVIALLLTAADLMVGDPLVASRVDLPWVGEAALATVLLAAVAATRLAPRPRVGQRAP